MKKSNLLLVLTSLGMMTVGAQAASTYLSVDGGALFLDDVDVAGLVTVEFDTAMALNAAIGYSMDNGVSVELQGGYVKGDLSGSSSFLGGSFDVSGELEMIPVFANVKYALPLGSSNVSLELGAGVGYVYSSGSVTASASTVAGNFSESAEDSGWDLCAQAMVGLNIKINDTTDFKVGYRLLSLEDGGFEDNLLGHYIGAGFNFRF